MVDTGAVYMNTVSILLLLFRHLLVQCDCTSHEAQLSVTEYPRSGSSYESLFMT
jgi:hypothetical protein